MQPRRILEVKEETIRGAALSRGSQPEIFAWGERAWLIRAKGAAQSRPLAAAASGGGCLADMDGDGKPDLILQETAMPGPLVWYDAARWQRRVIDPLGGMSDCIEAKLDGRRGLIVVHLEAQVRFYEPPVRANGRWPHRDIYSFYTPSRQRGLLLRDVDADGREDILCGNYWIRSPAEFGLPWRLFAVNLHFGTPDSAAMRLAMLGDDVAASQGEMAEGLLLRFHKPRDPRQLWDEERLASGLRFPRGLAVADFDGDGKGDVAVAEDAAAGRLVLLAGGGRIVETPAGHGVHTLLAADWNADGRPDLIAIGARTVTLWENHFRK